MSDQEIDREWKPNGRRPQSTIAQMFSQELMDIFRIDNSVADLDEKVDKRKQQINSQTSELEALEARIREMEQRLKKQNGVPNGSGQAASHNGPNAPPPPPEKDYSAQQNKYGGSRPGAAMQSQRAVPGALPPTPVGSEGDYELPVTRPLRIASQSPATRSQAQAHLRGSPNPRGVSPSPSSTSSSTARVKRASALGGDSDSVKSMSEGSTFADYVIVSVPDGDRERDA
ncbi:hypothetical protein MMYC01_209756 [Madurella mycetomatis]|uniref:Uncharacterized protein n=1 Tax=Madurella mycetomatis TaxID=100816 RepID=A0A175VQ11_9PEZI|nr:hypothetical protein MMYC01_209756 [Madurella mycetomatis]